MVIIIRRSISFFRTSFTLTSSLSARSLTVMPSARVISLVMGGGASTVRLVRRPVVAARGRDARTAGRSAGRRHAGRMPRTAAGGGLPGAGGPAATAAAAGRRAADAPTGVDGPAPRPAGRRPAAARPGGSAPAAPAAAGSPGAAASGRAAGASPVTGSSMRSRRVGGTSRPDGAAGRRGARRRARGDRRRRRGAGVAAAAGAAVVSGGGRLDGSGSGAARLSQRRAVPRPASGSAAARARWPASSAAAPRRRLDRAGRAGSSAAVLAPALGASAVGLDDGLDQARPQRGRRRLRRLGRALAGCLGSAAVVGEQCAGRQRDLPLARLPLDELPRHDLLDRARGALDVDARFLLEQSSSLPGSRGPAARRPCRYEQWPI